MHTRRTFLLAAAAMAVGGCRSEAKPLRLGLEASAGLASIEAQMGGRLGVLALDTGNAKVLALRADERFAMCSVFKWLLVGAVLAAVDRAELALDELLAYGPEDLLAYAPITSMHVDSGRLSIEALADAAITVSDNTAANLLLARLGGPGKVTEFARSLGDRVTRLDRIEPELNENRVGDPRDTSSPRAMVTSLRAALVGTALSRPSRGRLLDWLRGCATGATRLRAGFPPDWVVGDKTGTGPRQAVNDVAIAHPPGRAPIVIAAFSSDSDASVERLSRGLADVGRLIATYFA